MFSLIPVLIKLSIPLLTFSSSFVVSFTNSSVVFFIASLFAGISIFSIKESIWLSGVSYIFFKSTSSSFMLDNADFKFNPRKPLLTKELLAFPFPRSFPFNTKLSNIISLSFIEYLRFSNSEFFVLVIL